MASRKDEWDKAAKFVADHPELAELETHAQIYRFCDENKHTGKTLWPKVKTELRKQHGVDYDDLRARAGEIAQARADELSTLADGAPLVELYTAGELIEREDGTEVGAYAITDSEGTDVWYGTFHTAEAERITDSAAAATEAVTKAIWLAGKVREDAGLDVVAVRIHHSHPAIDQARTARAAIAASAALTLVHVGDDVDNPALAVCLDKPGYRDWHEHRLADLLAPVDATA